MAMGNAGAGNGDANRERESIDTLQRGVEGSAAAPDDPRPEDNSTSEAGASDSSTPLDDVELDTELGEIELDDAWDENEEIDEQDDDEFAKPLEELVESTPGEGDLDMEWYILKVQVNREKSICEALEKRVKIAGMDRFFTDLLVPTEDVREYNKSGKQRIVKRKLFPGYIVVRMHLCEESWFLVRDTPGIGDFTGAAGKPVPLAENEINRIIATTRPDPEAPAEDVIKTAIKFKSGDRVRVKDGYFQNYEGEVSNIDERNGRVTVMINIFGRPNPVELDHWQIETL